VLRNVALQRHISHVLLIDTEAEAQIRELTSNCVSFAEGLSDVFYDASSGGAHPLILGFRIGSNLAVSSSLKVQI
jgi:hypothetical protein